MTERHRRLPCWKADQGETMDPPISVKIFIPSSSIVPPANPMQQIISMTLLQAMEQLKSPSIYRPGDTPTGLLIPEAYQASGRHRDCATLAS